VRIGAAGVIAALVAGCASNASPAVPSIAPSGLPSDGPSSSAPATAAPSVPASPGGSVSAPASASAATTSSVLAIDPTLLELLPATIGPLDRQTDPDVDAHAFADPALARIATAGATALYADPGTGDFAFATVLRLRGSGIDERTFRDYRDSFDEGACSQAGGVGGRAQAEIAGRTTYIGSCAGGVFTYHTVVPSSNALLSISSAGAKRLGEQLVAAVR
jgi:hypothetical protein